MKRGEVLKFSLAFAMRGVTLQLGKRFVPLKLTEEQRYEIAGKVIANLTKYGDFWRLDEDMPENHPGPRTMGMP